MKINILGWYNKGNCGDEAFKLAFKKIFPTEELRFCTPDETTWPGADIHILGGGDVIKPYYLDYIKNYRMQHPGVVKDFYIVGAGLGYESELDLLKDLRPKTMFLRNLEDVYLAQAKGFDAEYTPDLVFNLDAADYTHLPITKKFPNKKTMAVFL